MLKDYIEKSKTIKFNNLDLAISFIYEDILIFMSIPRFQDTFNEQGKYGTIFIYLYCI